MRRHEDSYQLSRNNCEDKRGSRQKRLWELPRQLSAREFQFPRLLTQRNTCGEPRGEGDRARGDISERK